MSDSSSDDEFIERLGIPLKHNKAKKIELLPFDCEGAATASSNIEDIDIETLQCVEQIRDVIIPFPDFDSLPPMIPTVSEMSMSTIQAIKHQEEVPVSAAMIINEGLTLPINTVSQPISIEGPSHAPKVNILSDITFYGNLAETKIRQNKAVKDPQKWKKQINQDKRMKGDHYLGYRRDRKAKGNEKFKVIHDVFKPARSMKPACTSNFCVKSKLRGCNGITEASRKNIFDNFWKNMNWEQRRTFVCSHVISTEKKITKNTDSKRTESLSYVLTVDNNRIQVCKKMFLNTLGIKDWFIRYWHKKTDCAMPPRSSSANDVKCLPKYDAARLHAEQFLKSLPKMPSHYCRASTSREYLEPVFESKTQLYKTYKDKCSFESAQCLSRKTFDLLFTKLNLSLFQPKNDQCDLCCGFKSGNINEEQYQQHVLKKDRARKEKQSDKTKAEAGKIHVFTQDLQSVKLAPFLKASAILL